MRRCCAQAIIRIRRAEGAIDASHEGANEDRAFLSDAISRKRKRKHEHDWREEVDEVT